jgi:hypothetical protein
MTPHAMTQASKDMMACIDECQRCHATCLSTARHCLELGGAHAESTHITMLIDCADICRVSADFMLRLSSHHRVTCRACAEVCRACAEDCERLADGDQTMLRCVEECRSCQSSCEAMAA